MKQITPEVVLHVQTFLKNAGIFYGEPATDWSAQSLKALHEYRRRQGVRSPHNTMMPNSVEGLPEELQQYISNKEEADLIEVSGGEEDLGDLMLEGDKLLDPALIISTGAVLGETQLAILSGADHTTLTSTLDVGIPQGAILGGNNGDIEVVTTAKVDQTNAPAEEKTQEETAETKTEETPASTPAIQEAPKPVAKLTLPPLKNKKK